jgi:ATP-dependent Clp protease adaptor protein ClpS
MAGNPGKDDHDTDVAEPEGDTAVLPEVEKKLEKPKQYKVLLHNDDYTTMEFVVMCLMSIFHHAEPDAVQIMLHVHHHGVGVAGIFSYEIAETKAAKVTELARQHEYPLRATVEPD